MILVTVGTACFDPLIMMIDKLVETGAITDKVVAQIGRGDYEPRHFKYFRFVKSMEEAFEKADVIVSTGGAGTTLECVTKGRKLVVVENTSLMEGHQAQLIGEMERRGHLIWCKNLNDLAKCISDARTREFPAFVSDMPRAHELILQLLRGQD
ncbi:MAG: PssE/Cps14G family polysaccharide biosynthesis glycosyltransferase [Candidatus Thorarchaeota archaeon]